MSRRLLLVCFLAAWGLGCDVMDASLLEPGSSRAALDGEPPAKAAEAGPVAQCARDFDPAARELCNDVDDDCDGTVDERAAAACELPNAESTCMTGGRCGVVACVGGFLDCNGDDADGCETAEVDAPCGCEMSCGAAGAGADPADAPDAQDPAPDAAPAPEVPPAEEMDPPDEQQTEPQPMECEPAPEACNGEDDDCDGRSDEGDVCLMQACLDATPSGRGADCDACVCTSCRSAVVGCQLAADADVAMRCDAVVQCYVENPCTDCYASGDCREQVHLATGVDDLTDATFIGTRCTSTAPYACGYATAYRACVTTSCATECSD